MPKPVSVKVIGSAPLMAIVEDPPASDANTAGEALVLEKVKVSADKGIQVNRTSERTLFIGLRTCADAIRLSAVQ